MKQHFPATARNREPILTLLKEELPPDGSVFEVASGSGEHAAYFAPRLPGIRWQPSDADPVLVESIAAWREDGAATGLLAPVRFDVSRDDWPVAEADAVVAINLIHIAPWSVTEALFSGARDVLGEGGLVFLYGPYRRNGQHTAPSNAEFDASLKSRDPAWGVRDLDEVAAVASIHGFRLVRVVPMPANNLSVMFRRAAVPMAG